MAQSFKLFFITFAARVFMTCCEQGATISNFFPSLIIGFNILSMTSMLFISASETRICTSSMIHSSFFWSLINRGDEYPLSIFNPFVVSNPVSAPWAFSTVTIPFLPTLLYVSAIIFPTSPSLLADIVATSCSFLSVTLRALFFKFLTTSSVIETISRRTCVLLSPSFSSLSPFLTMASVSTIAVVVPSPALAAVREAASLIICTARFSTGSSSCIDLATVTPSFVTVIPCV